MEIDNEINDTQLTGNPLSTRLVLSELLESSISIVITRPSLGFLANEVCPLRRQTPTLCILELYLTIFVEKNLELE